MTGRTAWDPPHVDPLHEVRGALGGAGAPGDQIGQQSASVGM